MAAKKIKPLGKILIILGILGLLYLGYAKYLVKEKVKESVTLDKILLPTAPKNATTLNLQMENLPSKEKSEMGYPLVNYLGIGWNAQMGMIYANGGPYTTRNSIMEKNGINLHFQRQDDYGKMQDALVDFAVSYKKDPNTTEGTHFVGFMGDNGAAFLGPINKRLRELGPEYVAKVIYIAGFSVGEDGLMAPSSWITNPKSAHGKTICVVLRDGDWNIVIKWAFDNNLKVNPNETTYDPDAINFIGATTNLDAAEKYINGYTETRDVVKDGKRTGETKVIGIDAVSTWTPGDVNVAEKKGGLVKIVSTKQYSSQMPCVIVGISKYMEDNRDLVNRMIIAIGQGGDQVKSFSPALDKAAEISAQVWGEKDAKYWKEYYIGKTIKDKKGINVELGGSKVCNLGDNLEAFGLAENSINTYSIVYNVFGNYVVKLYPEALSSFPPADSVVDLSYLKDVAEQFKGQIYSAEVVEFNNEPIKNIVSTKNYSITFSVNSAEIVETKENSFALNEILESYTIARDVKIKLYGHTDNTGNPSANKELSLRRAESVMFWLMKKSPTIFPKSRFIEIKGFGDTRPLNDDPNTNSTEAGRALNRRVELISGS